MAIVTYLDANCLIAVADAEAIRINKVLALLNDKKRRFVYSDYVSLETLSQAIHYRKKDAEWFYRRYFNLCAYHSGNNATILYEAQRQAEKYGVVGIDACHLGAAIASLAEEYYTFEKPTKPMFRTKEIKVISLL